MEKVYLIYTLRGTFLDIVCKSKESAQKVCDELYAKNPHNSYIFHSHDLV